jgi:acetyltransferase
MNLDKIYNPRNIAIIGASAEKGSVGNALFMNAISSRKPRGVFPVNINRKKISGHNTFANVKEIKNSIDLAVIATPAAVVPFVLEDCISAGVKGAIIVSAGFNEAGAAGLKLYERIQTLVRDHDLRVMGPNCLGFINPMIDLNMSFAAKQALPGRVAFISQSGALCTSILDWSLGENIGFSRFISIGSMIDIDFSDLLEYLEKDRDTDSIVLYMESLRDAPRFVEIAKRVSASKRIFVLKSGRSLAGASAAKSHTGSLAGNDKAFDAIFREAGITRLLTIEDLFDCIKMAAQKTRNIGPRLAIITNAGGPGVLSTDALSLNGGILAKMSKETSAKLDQVLPSAWSRANPIDMIGDASPKNLKDTLSICLNDKNIDSIMVLLTPQSMTKPTEMAKELAKLKLPENKFIFSSFLGGEDMFEAKKILSKAKIPDFESPERAIMAFLHLSRERKNFKNSVKLKENPINIDKDKVQEIIAQAQKEKRKQLSESEAKALILAYNIPVLTSAVAASQKDIVDKAKTLRFPIAMKILSPDIMHKIDCGGVKLDIPDLESAQRAYEDIMRSVKAHHKDARIDGVYMEAMWQSDFELIIGVSLDPVLGPLLMFGRGGTEVELYKDIAFGVLPLSADGIFRMMSETKVMERIRGYRNTKGADIDEVVGLMLRIGQLIHDFPLIKELDINPLAVSQGKLAVLDAKIVLR